LIKGKDYAGGNSVRVRRLTITNFRSVAHGIVDFHGHTLLVGGNNVGKSTICEALELVLGPERLFRSPIIDEHDFHNGRYLDPDDNPVQIKIEAVLLDLPEEAQRNAFWKNATMERSTRRLRGCRWRQSRRSGRGRCLPRPAGRLSRHV
jgi:predicted ATP-dependent endonuclease of OLD family